MKREPFPNGDGTWSIPLTQGQVAIVDEVDLPLVSGVKWCALRHGRTFYAVRHPNRSEMLRMHRVIASASDGQQVDHVDRDGLNNRRSNLRVCTNAENGRNRAPNTKSGTGFIGVYRMASGNYIAQITINDKKVHLGTFPTPELAARARDEKASQVWGEFAYINLPERRTP